MVAIAEIMGYEIHICLFPYGRVTREFLNENERQNIITIMNGMAKANLLKQSKNGNMWKLVFAF